MEDFDRVYSKYFPEIYKFSLSLCQNQALAEEITQDVFFKALKSINGFKGDSKLSTWLCRIARNTYNDYLRKRKGAETLSENAEAEGLIEERLSDGETAHEIYGLLHALKEPYKEVFWLRTFGELSFARIAELFGKTESWARVTYYRAKTIIKERLK